jgi:hypothetical protein
MLPALPKGERQTLRKIADRRTLVMRGRKDLPQVRETRSCIAWEGADFCNRKSSFVNRFPKREPGLYEWPWPHAMLNVLCGKYGCSSHDDSIV